MPKKKQKKKNQPNNPKDLNKESKDLETVATIKKLLLAPTTTGMTGLLAKGTEQSPEAIKVTDYITSEIIHNNYKGNVNYSVTFTASMWSLRTWSDLTVS